MGHDLHEPNVARSASETRGLINYAIFSRRPRHLGWRENRVIWIRKSWKQKWTFVIRELLKNFQNSINSL